jgi:hypothetical protein
VSSDDVARASVADPTAADTPAARFDLLQDSERCGKQCQRKRRDEHHPEAREHERVHSGSADTHGEYPQPATGQSNRHRPGFSQAFIASIAPPPLSAHAK